MKLHKKRKSTPRHAHIPGPGELSPYRTKDVAGVIKVRTLRWRFTLAYPKVSKGFNPKDPCRGEAGESESERG